MKNIKSQPVKTILTISVGFIIIFLLAKWKWAIWVSLGTGLIGVFSPYLTAKVDMLWMKLAQLLGLIVPNILLTLVFYLFLFPISFLSKLFRKKDVLMLKNPLKTTYVASNKSFDKSSFEKPW